MMERQSVTQRNWGAASPNATDPMDRLFQPDILLPEQARPARVGPGEKRLVLAVLEDALHAVELPCRRHRGAHSRGCLRCQALAWIAADDPVWLFSFVNICDRLELDAAWLRRGVEEAQARRRAVPHLAIVTRSQVSGSGERSRDGVGAD